MNEHLEGEHANYAMELRATNPAKMQAMEGQVKQFIDTSGLLLEGESLNDKEIGLISNLVANRLHRKLKQSEDISPEDMNKTIEEAVLTGMAERLDMKEKGLRAPEL